MGNEDRQSIDDRQTCVLLEDNQALLQASSFQSCAPQFQPVTVYAATGPSSTCRWPRCICCLATPQDTYARMPRSSTYLPCNGTNQCARLRFLSEVADHMKVLDAGVKDKVD